MHILKETTRHAKLVLVDCFNENNIITTAYSAVATFLKYLACCACVFKPTYPIESVCSQQYK